MEFKDIKNRIGKFTIQKEFIEAYPEMAIKLLSKILIVRAETMFNGYIDYVGCSMEFEKVTEGQKFNSYTFIIDTNKKETTFKKVN